MIMYDKFHAIDHFSTFWNAPVRLSRSTQPEQQSDWATGTPDQLLNGEPLHGLVKSGLGYEPEGGVSHRSGSEGFKGVKRVKDAKSDKGDERPRNRREHHLYGR